MSLLLNVVSAFLILSEALTVHNKYIDSDIGIRGSVKNWKTNTSVKTEQGDSREVVAVKVVAKKSLNKASTENLLTEIEILKTMRHPHIVQLKDFQVSSFIYFFRFVGSLQECVVNKQ